MSFWGDPIFTHNENPALASPSKSDEPPIKHGKPNQSQPGARNPGYRFPRLVRAGCFERSTKRRPKPIFGGSPFLRQMPFAPQHPSLDLDRFVWTLVGSLYLITRFPSAASGLWDQGCYPTTSVISSGLPSLYGGGFVFGVRPSLLYQRSWRSFPTAPGSTSSTAGVSEGHALGLHLSAPSSLPRIGPGFSWEPRMSKLTLCLFCVYFVLSFRGVNAPMNRSQHHRRFLSLAILQFAVAGPPIGPLTPALGPLWPLQMNRDPLHFDVHQRVPL